MEDQLTRRAPSENEALLAGPIASSPEAEISEEELEALLSEAQLDLLHRPVPKNVEFWARVSVLVFADMLAVMGAIVLAYWLRYTNTFMVNTFTPETVLPFKQVMYPLLVWIPFLLISLKISGMYNVHARIQTLDKIPKIFGSVNAYIISFLLVSFLFNVSAIARGFIVFFWLFCIVFILLGRTILQLMMSMAGIPDSMMRKTLIVGSGKVGKEVARKLQRHKGFGLQPIGFIDDDPLYREYEEPELRDLKVLGGLGDFCRIMKDFKVEKVIIAFNGASCEQLLDLASKCNQRGVECSIVPRLFEVITNEISVNEVGGIPLLRIREKKIRGISHALKTVEDYILGTIILFVAAPLLMATAIAIKLDSPGPVFFRHKRIGKNGETFECLKFRSMVENAASMQAEMVESDNGEHGWLCWKRQDDPRITRVGKWIRKFSIDELPQIFNVMKGDMSVVGPRPHIQQEVDQYKEWHKQRLNVKPGITGLWQVSGRNELPFDEMIKLDLFYIERWSPWMDFKIVLRTISAVFHCRGAC